MKFRENPPGPTSKTVSDCGACSPAPTGFRQRRNVPDVNLVRMPRGPAYDCHRPKSFTRTSSSVRSFTQFRFRVRWHSGVDCTCQPCGGQASLVRLETARLGTAKRKALGVRRKQCLLVKPSGFVHTPGPPTNKPPRGRLIGWRRGWDCACPPYGGQASLARLGTAKRKALGVRRKQCLLVKPSGFVHTPGPPTNKPPRGRLIGWRRGWDSNPRAGKTRPSDFESAPLWPLRYLSGSRGILTVLWATNGHGSFVD